MVFLIRQANIINRPISFGIGNGSVRPCIQLVQLDRQTSKTSFGLPIRPIPKFKACFEQLTLNPARDSDARIFATIDIDKPSLSERWVGG
jgi:hypothetical protein